MLLVSEIVARAPLSWGGVCEAFPTSFPCPSTSFSLPNGETKNLERSMADLSKNDLTPLKGVQQACQNGLDLKDEHGGKGLVENTIHAAQQMAKGKAIDEAHVKKMHGWFARHETDKREGWNNPPTPGFVAWQLWGGDAGKRWVDRLYERMQKGA